MHQRDAGSSYPVGPGRSSLCSGAAAGPGTPAPPEHTMSDRTSDRTAAAPPPPDETSQCEWASDSESAPANTDAQSTSPLPSWGGPEWEVQSPLTRRLLAHLSNRCQVEIAELVEAVWG